MRRMRLLERDGDGKIEWRLKSPADSNKSL
jgi:hypothetical protein